MGVSLIITAFICAIAAFIQGFSGFGLGITFMGSMSLLGADFERASVMASIFSSALCMAVLLQAMRRVKFDFKQAALIIAGLAIGTPIGYKLLVSFGEMPVGRVIFGVTLVLFALHRIFAAHLHLNIPLALAPVFGFLSGLLSGAFASGGPPVVMYLYSQEKDPRKAIGTVQGIFLASGLYRLVIISTGEIGISSQLLGRALLLMPLVILAGVLGFRLAHRFSAASFSKVVYGIIVVMGAVNVYRGACGCL